MTMPTVDSVRKLIANATSNVDKVAQATLVDATKAQQEHAASVPQPPAAPAVG
jgi:hypothetical protein